MYPDRYLIKKSSLAASELHRYIGKVLETYHKFKELQKLKPVTEAVEEKKGEEEKEPGVKVEKAEKLLVATTEGADFKLITKSMIKEAG